MQREVIAYPWLHRAFSVVGLPNPTPEIFTQLGGGLLIGYAYLLWISPNEHSIAPTIGWVVGVVNIAGAALILWWVLFSKLSLPNAGIILLFCASALLIVFAVGEIHFAISTYTNHRTDKP